MTSISNSEFFHLQRLTPDSNLGLKNVGSLTYPCCEAKKDAQGPYYWAQKKFLTRKIKIEGVAFISNKKLESHFRDPGKRVFFIFVFLEVFLHVLLQTLV